MSMRQNGRDIPTKKVSRDAFIICIYDYVQGNGQWFNGNGIMVLSPLPEHLQSSMVWALVKEKQGRVLGHNFSSSGINLYMCLLSRIVSLAAYGSFVGMAMRRMRQYFGQKRDSHGDALVVAIIELWNWAKVLTLMSHNGCAVFRGKLFVTQL